MKGVNYYEKIYYVYVALELKDYFENKSREHGSTILTRDLVKISNNLSLYYTLEAEEGIIDPKWELKTQY